MKCPFCNQVHPKGTLYCPITGNKMPAEGMISCINKDCPNFGKMNIPHTARYCPVCGKPTCSDKNERIKVITINGVSFNMIRVEAGSFEMGEEYDNYVPKHKVTITHDYYIGETVVTNRLILAILTYNEINYKELTNWGIDKDNVNIAQEELSNMLDQPCTDINWYAAKDIIRFLRKITREKFDLPTEAEWEYAARGGKKSKSYLYSGSNDIDDVAWYKENSDFELKNVAQKEPNELGLYDMSGLVNEWCNDWFDEDYYYSTPPTNPHGPNYGQYKVIRGGCVKRDDYECEITNRLKKDPVTQSDDRRYTGFRLVIHL